MHRAPIHKHIEGTPMKRIVFALFAAAFGLTLLAGCNTMQGFGKDVQKVGDKIEESAARKK
jgi:predicted small secreted protein